MGEGWRERKDMLHTHTEIAKEMANAGGDARRRKETRYSRRECLAFSVINSNRLRTRVSLTHLLSGRRGSTATASGASRWRRTNALPRNRGFDRSGIHATGWPSGRQNDRWYIAVYSSPTACTHKSLLCDPRNSHFPILTSSHFRRAAKLPIAVISAGIIAKAIISAIESHAPRQSSFCPFFYLSRRPSAIDRAIEIHAIEIGKWFFIALFFRLLYFDYKQSCFFALHGRTPVDVYLKQWN